MPTLSHDDRQHEIIDASNEFGTLLNEKAEFFRLPYGAGVSVPEIREMIASQNMIHVFWNVDTLDWQDKNPKTIYTRALKQMNALGRGVILFHDIHPQSVIASEMVMGYLKDPANNIRTVTLPEIIKEMNDKIKVNDKTPVDAKPVAKPGIPANAIEHAGDRRQ